MAEAIKGRSGNEYVMDIDALGGIVPTRSVLATCTSIASSATTVTILAENIKRKGLLIRNQSTSDMFIKFGTGCDFITGNFSIGLVKSSSTTGSTEYRMETQGIYAGIITGHWYAANGYCTVTEW
jgi:hypothetical protein